MKRFCKKLKEWATDSPREPRGTLAELYIPKVPMLTTSGLILKHGLPFHIQWAGEGIRADN